MGLFSHEEFRDPADGVGGGASGIVPTGECDDGDWVIVWRPRDPQWRLSADAADVETVASPIYAQAMDRWAEAVDTFADLYRSEQ